MSRIALVIAGGDPPPPDHVSILPPPVITVAADSGVNHARALDLGVDVVVGDLDSADEAAVRWAVEQGAVIDVHSPTKDQTDLELALDRVSEAMAAREIDEVVVIGLGGGRLDHWLANLLTLAGPRTRSVEVTAYVDRGRVCVIRGRRTLTGRPGELLSLIPVGGPANGVTTSGLEYPLRGETLDAGTARGVSNVFARTDNVNVGSDGGRGRPTVVTAEVSVTSGTLLAVQPEFLTAVDRPAPGPGKSSAPPAR